jgi:uncharacterized membrane protein
LKAVPALRATAAASLAALVLLCLAWELWLAPLRPGGSWLALKALPLVVPLAGIASGRRYTYQWTSMFILAYFIEGVMRAWGDAGISRSLALAEVLLSVVFFACVIAYSRLTRQPPQKAAA